MYGATFLAYTDLTGKDWKKLSVYPSKLVESGKLGKPVKNLDGVLRQNVNLSELKIGDMVYFLVTEKIYESDVPLVNINDVPYWAWRMGIYAGHGSILNAKPSCEVVREFR